MARRCPLGTVSLLLLPTTEMGVPEPDTVFLRRLEHRVDIEWRIVTVALVTLTFLLGFFAGPAGLGRWDSVLYDWTLSTTQHVLPSSDIVVVAIDDGSLKELGYWPWRRGHHAKLIEQLGQARAVGTDIVFMDQNPAYPDDDARLAQAIRKHGRVILPLIIDEAADAVVRPLPPLAAAASHLGHINVVTDDDGLTRSVVLQHQGGGVTIDHFALALLDAGGDTDAASRQRQQFGLSPQLIRYVGSPGSFTMFPYHRVIAGEVPASAFNDKYVLIGAWASALGDALAVPISREGTPMAGIEVLANTVQGALEDSWIRTPSRWQGALLGVIPVLLVCVGLRHFSPRLSFFSSLGGVVLVLFVVWLSMRFLGYWFAPAASLAGMILAYPVWGWRSQEAALGHIDAELHGLTTGQGAPEGDTAGPIRAGRSLSARVQALQRAIALLRESVRQREQTLHFLSHDMRSPQSSILALTQLQRDEKTSLPSPVVLDRIDEYANTTLALVDGFVQLARAETMSLNLRPVNLSDLLAEACDARWPMAQMRGMQITVDTAFMEAWVWADGAMLVRAVGNLLDNAINYSDDGKRITCRLTRTDDIWLLSICDQGRGIGDIERDTLFTPFKRLYDGEAGQPAGSGLGLAFVRAVVLRHSGSIDVESTEGEGSCFTIGLPVLLN